jgi:hypothetical protein
LKVSVLQSKDTDLQIRFKNKPQPFVDNKKHTSLTKTNTDDIPSKWSPKASSSSYLHIWQNRLQPKIRRDKESNFILIKGTIQQEDMAIVNICTLNVSTPNFIKQTLLDIRTQSVPNIILASILHSCQLIDQRNKKEI